VRGSCVSTPIREYGTVSHAGRRKRRRREGKRRRRAIFPRMAIFFFWGALRPIPSTLHSGNLREEREKGERKGERNAHCHPLIEIFFNIITKGEPASSLVPRHAFRRERGGERKRKREKKKEEEKREIDPFYTHYILLRKKRGFDLSFHAGGGDSPKTGGERREGGKGRRGEVPSGAQHRILLLPGGAGLKCHREKEKGRERNRNLPSS